MGLINVEDRGTVCEKGAKPPNCGMSDFTTRSLTWCLGNSSGSIPRLALALCGICALC